jgi:hypothetical protein
MLGGMNCDPTIVICQLQQISAELADKSPSPWEITGFVVACVGVLASVVVALIALRIANRANSIAVNIRAEEVAAERRQRRVAVAKAARDWAWSREWSGRAGAPFPVTGESTSELAARMFALNAVLDDRSGSFLWNLINNKLNLPVRGDTETERTQFSIDRVSVIFGWIDDFVEDPALTRQAYKDSGFSV